MKKNDFLKTVLSVAFATLMTVGAFGQVTFVNDNYKRYDSDVAAPDTVEYVTLKTGGTTMGYYANPDPVYHPNYSAAGAWTLTPNFLWNWSIVPVMTITQSGAANYATINFTGTGNYVVNVTEEAPAAFGGCIDGTPTVMNVTVINPPSAGFTTADDTVCGDFGAQTITMAINENVPANWASWAFAVVRITENINSSGQRIGAALDSTTLHDFTLAAKGRRASTANFGGAQPNYTYTITTPALTIQNSLRTRYTYRLYTPAGATVGTGIVSSISQKSDFLTAGTVTAYAFTDAQVVYTANPAPVTGPIYHIPNNFSY